MFNRAGGRALGKIVGPPRGFESVILHCFGGPRKKPFQQPAPSQISPDQTNVNDSIIQTDYRPSAERRCWRSTRSALLEGPPRALLSIFSDRVQYDVGVPDHILEARLFIVDRVVDAQLAQKALVTARGRADDVSTLPFRELNRESSDTRVSDALVVCPVSELSPRKACSIRPLRPLLGHGLCALMGE